ncbi:lamin tail domain-containing protein [bacterium]|nr:lamin tail domain-containing protein [bacterium]
MNCGAGCDTGDVTAPVWASGSNIAVADAQSGGTLDISWDAATDPENGDYIKYALYRSTETGFTVDAATLIDTNISTLAYNDTGLTNGSTYYYIVQAYNCAALQTSNSDEDFGIPTDPAQAPTLLTANGGDTLVGLTWSSVTGSDEYRVYYSTFDGGPYTLIHSTTANSYEQTGLTNGTTYYYVVVNYDAEKYPAVSANSNQLSAVPDVPSQNDIDVSGWKIVQYSSTNTYTIPNGIIIPEGGYLVVGRNADKTAFETFWGVTLASDVIYVNSSNSMPLINGDEYFELLNDSDVSQDGPSAKTLSVNNTVERTNPGDPAGDTTSWTMTASTSATPGSGVGASSNAGVIVNEYSDASSYEYEFVELYNDTTGPPDLTPPVFAGIQSVTDTQLGGELELAWNTATDTSTPIMYNVYMSTASAGQNFASVSYSTYSLSYLITGLENGTQYYFVVRAEDSRGNEDTNTIEISGTPTSKFSDPGFGDILINEFSAKGTERIEIYNTSGIDTFNLCSVDIESYTGVDEVDVVTGRSYIEPGEYLTFFPDNIGLSNLGNTIVMTIGVTTIDQVAYGVEGGAPIAYTGYSTARVATTGNDADDWNRDTTPTFGSVNDAPAVSLGTSVVINEYMKDAGSDTNVLELYNPTGGDIDVTGWLFTDADDSVGDIGTLSGTVTADSYLVFTRDAGTPMADVVISGDNVYLYDASGIRVDQASDFGHTFTAGNTAQRVPNGTGGTNNGYDWASAGFTEQEPTWNESNDLCNYSDVTAPDWAVSGISNVAGIENGDHISVSWDAAIDAENPDRIFYSVYRSTETPFTINASTLIETDLQTLAYDDYSVIKGETNYYMIATYNCNVLETEGTDEVAVYMPNPPITPLLITCVGGNNYVFIDWSDVAGVDHYVIYSSTESGGPYSEVNTTVVSQYSDSGLINGVTYYYVVTSYDTDKDPFESPYSNEKFAIPEECLPIGDTVMISEIMIYPRAEITNEEGEWIELYNPTASPISIVGWSLSDTGIDTYTIPAGCPSVPAYDYLVLGATDNLILNDYVAVDFVYNRATGGPGAFALGNSGDEVILKDAAGDTIDMLIYTSAWFDQGYSITKEDIMACSDEQSSWGNETTQWNPPDSSYGTPGTSNFPFGFYYAMAPSLIRIEFSFTHEVDMATADDVAKYLLYETATPANEVSLTVLTFSGDITTGYFSCVALTPGVEYTIEIIGAMQDAYFHPVTDSHKLTTFIAPTPLLEGDNPILFPEWSKDGTKVAYIVYNKLTGKSNIWKQNRDGTDAMQVTVDADNVSHAGQFSFSPNGAYFIFTADGGGYTQIRRISKTGGEASVLMEPVSEFTSNWGRWCDPHWGSSANQFGGTERVICSISGELWAYDPVTIRNTDVSLIKLTELTSGTYTDTYAVSDKLLQPKWAPDNTAITFVRRHAGEGVTNSDIYVISNIQSYIAAVNTVSSWVNSDVELISGYSEPCWSPSISVDGTQVSYVIDQNNAFSNVDFWTDPDAEFASANFDAYYEAVDGSQSDGSVLEANPYNEGFMKWAPAGGDQFIYTSRDSGGIYSLNVINHQITQGFTKSGLRVQDYSLSSMDITEGGYLSSLTIESPIHIPEIMGNYEYIGESRKFSSAGNDDAMINAVVSIHFMNEELKDRLTSSLKLLYYNEVMGDWEELASKVELDSIGGCVSAEVYSLGIYAIASKASVVSDDLGDVVVYPNPYYAVDLTAPLSFETKWAVEEILIYSVSGELLDISLVDFDDTQSPQLGSGGYTNRYDLSKSKLEDYASGVYLIVFKGAEETVTCKFALIK